MKLKTTEVAPLRETLRKRQKDICPLCGCKLSENLPSLDHDHETGAIRDVLCRNCNQVEGRLLTWIKRGSRGMDKYSYLRRLMRYWKKHSISRHGKIHPTHGKPRKRRRRRRKK